MPSHVPPGFKPCEVFIGTADHDDVNERPCEIPDGFTDLAVHSLPSEPQLLEYTSGSHGLP